MKQIIFSIIVFILYCVITASKYGIQKSISMTAKRLGKYDFIFYLWGILWLVPLMTVSVNGLWFGALTIQAFVFATYAFYKNKMAKIVHIVTSIVGPLIALVAISVEVGWWYVPIALSVACLVYAPTNNRIWWTEIAAFGLIVIPLLIINI